MSIVRSTPTRASIASADSEVLTPEAAYASVTRRMLDRPTHGLRNESAGRPSNARAGGPWTSGCADQRLVLLAGDASYTQDLMLAGVADGVTTSPATDRDSLRRIRELARFEPTVYLPTHDPDARRRLEAMEAAPRRD